MKLQVTFEMPLPEGSAPFIEAIALTHGWTTGSEVTAHEFICKSICEPQVSALFSSLIYGALSTYYGISGAAQLNEVIEQYKQTHLVSATVSD
jgi:hypothetical protein